MKLIKILPVVFLFSVFLVSGYPDTICYPLSSGTVCFNTTTITGVGDYGATSGDNTSWNQSLASSLYAPISTVGDNTSWNESLADSKYALVGAGADNTSWNETRANTLYSVKTSLNSTYWQRRVSNCSVGSSIREIGSDGSVVCETDTDTQLSDGDIAAMGYIKTYTETDPNIAGNITAVNTNINNNRTAISGNIAGNLSLSYTAIINNITSLTTTMNLQINNNRTYIYTMINNNYTKLNTNLANNYTFLQSEIVVANQSGNTSFNKTYTDTLYYSITNPDGYISSYTETDPLWQGNWSGYNKANWDVAYSWGNHSAAGYLTSYTETDPNWAANMTLYVPKGTINAWTLVKANISDFPTLLSSFTDDLGHVEDNTSWNQGVADGLYYAIDNPDGFITEYQNLTEDNVEAYIFDNDNTANLNMSGYNITGVNSIVMSNGMRIYALNSSVLRIGS